MGPSPKKKALFSLRPGVESVGVLRYLRGVVSIKRKCWMTEALHFAGKFHMELGKTKTVWCSLPLMTYQNNACRGDILGSLSNLCRLFNLKRWTYICVECMIFIYLHKNYIILDLPFYRDKNEVGFHFFDQMSNFYHPGSRMKNLSSKNHEKSTPSKPPAIQPPQHPTPQTSS